MKLNLAMACCMAALGCGPSSNNQTAPAQNVAAVGRGSATTVVIATIDQKHRLAEVLAGSKPTDFNWVSLAVLAPKSDELSSSQGLTADFADAASKMTFEVALPDPCGGDETPSCPKLRTFVAGDPGLTGSVERVRLTDTMFWGNIEIFWEGVLGDPTNHVRSHLGFLAGDEGVPLVQP